MPGQPDAPARVIRGTAQVLDNFLDDLLRRQRMEIGDQYTTAEEPGIMRELSELVRRSGGGIQIAARAGARRGRQGAAALLVSEPIAEQ